MLPETFTFPTTTTTSFARYPLSSESSRPSSGTERQATLVTVALHSPQKLRHRSGISTDPVGRLYIADTGNQRVRGFPDIPPVVIRAA